MYEFVCGGVPFGENEEDPMNVYLAIINRYVFVLLFTYLIYFSDVSFPSFCKDKEFKNFILCMLNKNLLNRLYKLKQIKLHPYLSNFDWVKTT